jgi:hypothetical protein
MRIKELKCGLCKKVHIVKCNEDERYVDVYIIMDCIEKKCDNVLRKRLN